MNTETQERTALDEFAAAPVAQLPAVTLAAPIDIHGAQALDVYRDDARSQRKIAQVAALLGSEAFYDFPVRNRKTGQTDHIIGLGIKGALLVARYMMNVKVDCRVEDFGNAWMFHARVLDLETGFELTRPFQQRKSAARIGGKDDGRREDMALQIGASKAIRNAIVNTFPEECGIALEAAKNSLREKIGHDPEAYRRRLIERLGKRVGLERVEAVIGRPAKDWTVKDMSDVTTAMSAVANGDATLDESFPPLADEPRREKPDAALDKFAGDAGPSGNPPPDTAAGELDTPQEAPAADEREMLGGQS
jgi:hypothetical protein